MAETDGGGAVLAKLSAASLVAGLALIEPAMARLEKFGDALKAKQYLFIMPTGEVSYFFPGVRDVSIRAAGSAGIGMVLLGLVPAVARLKRKGLDGLSALGWALYLTAAVMLTAEYSSHGEWVIMRRIGARYLSFAMLAVGAFLANRDRKFLATLGLLGFTWDLSSAIFWAWLKKDITATVPVPWYHHFDQEEGRGAPCWGVMLLDSSAIAYFSWLMRHDFDPFHVYDR